MVEMLTVMGQLHAMVKPIMSETGSMHETGWALLEGLARQSSSALSHIVGFKVLFASFSCTDLSMLKCPRLAGCSQCHGNPPVW